MAGIHGTTLRSRPDSGSPDAAFRMTSCTDESPSTGGWLGNVLTSTLSFAESVIKESNGVCENCVFESLGAAPPEQALSSQAAAANRAVAGFMLGPSVPRS